MTTAWLLFASFGIFLARYFKYIMPGKKILDLAVWFVLHRAIMIAIPLVSIGAFVIILADLGWSWVEMSEPLAFSHSIIGIVTVGLSIIQVSIILNFYLVKLFKVRWFAMKKMIGGFLRPDKDDAKRPTFNLIHRILGISSFLLSSNLII